MAASVPPEVPTQDGKWRGAVTQTIAAPIEKVWELLSDFAGYAKNFPLVAQTCEIIEGEGNKPGARRRLTGVAAADGTPIWAEERLVTLDHVNHITTYALESSSLGWTGYQGKIVAESIENAHTRVVWSFEMDPSPDSTEEEYTALPKALCNATLGFTAAKLVSS